LIGWLPTVNEVTVTVALPVLSSVAAPTTVPPSLKVTVPLGVPDPPPEAATIAVRVTAWPKTLGLGLWSRPVDVELLLTVWTREGELAAA